MAEAFVAKATEMTDGDRRIVTVGDKEIGVFFKDGEYFAYRNLCVHAGGPVCEGLLINRVIDLIDEDLKYQGQTFFRRSPLRVPMARLRIRPQNRQVCGESDTPAAELRRRGKKRRHPRPRLIRRYLGGKWQTDVPDGPRRLQQRVLNGAISRERSPPSA